MGDAPALPTAKSLPISRRWRRGFVRRSDIPEFAPWHIGVAM
jgi:hypothetical protein